MIKKELSARDFIKQFVLSYTRDNIDRLRKLNSDVNDNILIDIENEPLVLDWMLSEVLYKEFKESGIIVKSEWKDEYRDTIYKINGQLIRERYCRGFLSTPFIYQFVQLVKKKITIYEYESLK